MLYQFLLLIAAALHATIKGHGGSFRDGWGAMYPPLLVLQH